MARRRIAADWQLRYAYRPVLLETFVETPRFAGTSYKAANWLCVGQTKGMRLSPTAFPPQPPPTDYCGLSSGHDDGITEYVPVGPLKEPPISDRIVAL